MNIRNPIVPCSTCGREMTNNVIGRHEVTHDPRRAEDQRLRKNARQRAYNQTLDGQATKHRRVRSEAGKAGFYRRRAKWRKSDSGRAAMTAHQAVRRAVKDGRLTRLPCEVCANPKSYGHHHLGYAAEYRLAVRWLCLTHHMEAHDRVAA